MIWLTWRQHRKQALFTAARAGGARRVHRPDRPGDAQHLRRPRTGRLPPRAGHAVAPDERRGLRHGVRPVHQPVRRLICGRHPVPRPAAAGRAVLGRAAGRPRGRAGHPPAGLDPGRQPPALGTGQVRAGRRGRAGRAAVVYGLGMAWWLGPLSQVGQRGRFDVVLLRPAGRRPGRLHAVRGRARHLRRHGLAQGAARRWRSRSSGSSACASALAHAGPAALPAGRDPHIPGRWATAERPDGRPATGSSPSGVRNAAGELVRPDARSVPARCRRDREPTAAPSSASKPGAYNWQLYQPGRPVLAVPGHRDRHLRRPRRCSCSTSPSAASAASPDPAGAAGRRVHCPATSGTSAARAALPATSVSDGPA